MTAEKIDHSGTVIDRIRKTVGNRLRIRNHFIRELLAEVIGTAFLVMMGEAGVATQVLSRNKSGDALTENLAWGWGVFFALLMTSNVSGGHFNPAVTFTFALLGRTPWKKVIPYIMAQVLGGFIGGGVVFLTFIDAINAFDGGIRQIDGVNGTAGIFSTYPQQFLSVGGAVWDQIIGTCALILAVLAATDPRSGLPSYAIPFAISFYVTMNGFTFAYNAGAGVNPARDLGPRIMSLAAGYGVEVFSYRNYTWFWIPTFCPLIGGVLAAVVFNLMIGIHYPPKSEAQEVQESTKHTCGHQCSFAKMLMEDPDLRRVYLTQHSLERLDVPKRESMIPLVR